jgi:hypothetical protein
MDIRIHDLRDDEHCYGTVRRLRWPERVKSLYCASLEVIKRGPTTANRFVGVMSERLAASSLMI